MCTQEKSKKIILTRNSGSDAATEKETKNNAMVDTNTSGVLYFEMIWQFVRQ